MPWSNLRWVEYYTLTCLWRNTGNITGVDSLTGGAECVSGSGVDYNGGCLNYRVPVCRFAGIIKRNDFNHVF